jgi:hypothetical protein
MDVQVERSSAGLSGRPVEDGGDTCEWRGTRMEYATRSDLVVWASKPSGGRVYGFGPQNPDGGSEKERMACDGIGEFVSRRSYLMKGAVAVG